MPDFALELSFEEPGDRAVREQWAALQDAGLPSQADHKGMTNAPHLTLVAARTIPAPVVELAGRLITLPAVLTVRGLVLFGEGSRITVAHLIEPDAELAAVVTQLRAAVPDVRHPVWTPHLTLARRVPRDKVAAVLEVLHAAEPVRALTATRLRWWDPEQHVVEDVPTGR